MEEPTWLYLIGGGGLATVFGSLASAAVNAIKNKDERAETRNASMTVQRDTAVRERNEEYAKRLEAEQRYDEQVQCRREILAELSDLRLWVVRKYQISYDDLPPSKFIND